MGTPAVERELFAADVLLTRMEGDGQESMQATVRDITDGKRVRLGPLRASGERHRITFGRQWTDSGVDTQTSLEVNEAYCRMSGYTEQELLTMSIPDLEATELPVQTASHVQKVVYKGEDRFESVHRRKDGSTFDVEVSCQFKPIEGGRIVGFMHNITHAKGRREPQGIRREIACAFAGTRGDEQRTEGLT
jgi:PAS domain S-box-containing protein